uniref:Uncharacterized protein n=1 Tax=Arundo donax TaxID=35708 RepID=A0A0A9EQ09_ARUDO
MNSEPMARSARPQGHITSTAILDTTRSSNESSSFLLFSSRPVPAAAAPRSAPAGMPPDAASVTAGRNSPSRLWPPPM